MTATVNVKKADAVKTSFSALKVLLFLVCFNASSISAVRGVGNIAMYLIIALTVLTVIVCNKYIVVTKLHIALTAYAAFCAFTGLFLGISVSTISQILVIGWISIFSNRLGRGAILKGVDNVLSALMLFCFIDVIMFRLRGSVYFFGNPNRIGIIGFLFVAVRVLCQRRVKLLPIILGLVLIVLCSARTPLMVLVLGLIAYWVLNKTKKAGTAKFLFLLLLAVGTLFIYLYVNAQDYDSMLKLNGVIYKLTGKNLFSGRQIIWKGIFDNFNYDKIIFGYGLNFEVAELSGRNMSAHNQFIQILVQQGIVGLVLWLSVLFAIFVAAFKNGNKKGCAFILMIIMYNLFEVFLMQNHFALGLICWMVFFADVQPSKKPQTALAAPQTALAAQSI